MHFRSILLLLPGLLLMGPVDARANDDRAAAAISVEARVVKAAYVYNFTKFVDWVPVGGAATPSSPITICVVGSDPVGDALDEVASLRAQGRSIRVLHVEDGESLPVCDLLYIASSVAPQLPRILAQVSKASVLTVSDIPHFIEQGGMIGFVLEQGRVRIEINVPQVRASGLKVSSKLLEIARNTPKENA